MTWYSEPTEEEKALQAIEYELHLVYGWLEAAEQKMHLTAFGAGGLAFLAGFGIGWLVFVR